MPSLREFGAQILIAPIVFFLATQSGWAGHRPVRGEFVDEAPSYQINVAHTGSTTLSTGFKTPLTLLWSVDLHSALSFPVIGDGAVYVMDDDHVLTALEMTTGKKRWSRSVAAGSLSNVLGPAYDNGTVFVSTTSNYLQAVTSKNGKSKWLTALPRQPDSTTPPMAVNGQVFAVGQGEGGTFYAVSQADGEVQWQQAVTNGFYSVPTYGDNGVFVTYPCHFYKFDPATGAVGWVYVGFAHGGGGETSVYLNKKLYIEDDGVCGDIIAKSGNGFFKASFGQDDYMGAFRNPTLFTSSKGKDLGLSIIGTAPNSLVCWNGNSGQKEWSFDGDGDMQANPIVVNDVIVTGSRSGTVYFLNEKGRQIWSTKTPSVVTSLTAGEGALIVVSESFVSAYASQ